MNKQTFWAVRDTRTKEIVVRGGDPFIRKDKDAVEWMMDVIDLELWGIDKADLEVVPVEIVAVK